MGRSSNRLNWKLGNWLFKFLSWVSARLGPSKIRSDDVGIFDPYLPLGSLKKVEVDYGNEIFASSEIMESNISSRRSYFILKAITFLIAGLFIFRLISLQITQGQENYRLAEGNRLKTTLTAAPRGLIYDRNGVALVTNVPSYSLLLPPG